MKCHHPCAEKTDDKVHGQRVYKCQTCAIRFIHRCGDDGFDYLVELGRETNESDL